MGWLSLRNRRTGPSTTALSNTPHTIEHTIESAFLKASADHVEDIGCPSAYPPHSVYPIQSSTVHNNDLPFIPPAEVCAQRASCARGTGRVWIVIDNIVYDCTKFIEEHPGGETVIASFIGEDCSWQFWRFHPKKVMEEWGRQLRIGRTSGVENRFKEPPRYFGSSKFS